MGPLNTELSKEKSLWRRVFIPFLPFLHSEEWTLWKSSPPLLFEVNPLPSYAPKYSKMIVSGYLPQCSFLDWSIILLGTLFHAMLVHYKTLIFAFAIANVFQGNGLFSVKNLKKECAKEGCSGNENNR